ncbi:MAG TPA: hypothetical protein DCM87_18025 [Planctomycetes bacterium]|nr:hypothetical protein [Planctomycetota bacterium]
MSARNVVAGVAVCLALGRAAGGDLGIVINEINYHAVHGAGFAPAELAWLELCNRDAQAVDLSGWSFARGIRFTFPAGTVLPGGGFLALCRNRAACAAVWPDVPWLGEFELHLAKGGERVTLCNARAAVIDSVFYSDARPWPDRADGGGATLELRDANEDNDDPANWASSLVAGGTPGRRNSAAVPGAALIGRNAPWRFWRGESAPPGAPGEWIEPGYDDGRWEVGESPIGFGSGVYTLTALADMRDAYTTVFTRAAFDVADPGAFERIELLADFDDGFAAYLNGREIVRVLIAGTGVPERTAVAAATHKSQTPCVWRISPDALQAGRNVLAILAANQNIGSSTFVIDAALSGVAGSAAPPRPALALNEIGPEAGGGAWVELRNESAEEIALDGLALGADIRALTPLSGRIGGGGFAVFSLGSLPRSGTLMLVRGPELWHAAQLKYRLIEGESWGRYPTGGRGYFTMPTPGAANGARPHRQVVISEINYHPESGDDRDEFIELHNSGATPVDLSGWRFESGIAYEFTSGIVLEPGGYLLVVPDAARAATLYGGAAAAGDYAGRLSDKSERIVLADALGREIADFHYADDGGWPREADGPACAPDPDYPEETCGAGMTLELRHAGLEPDSGGAWVAETAGGTPGRGRVQAGEDPPPAIYDCGYEPVLPVPGQAVRFTVKALCPAGVESAAVKWRYSDDSSWRTVPLADNGAGGDEEAGDARWTGLLTGADRGGTIVWHCVAESMTGADGVWPRGAPDKHFLLRVDARPFLEQVTSRFAYLLMTEEDLSTLRTRPAGSNALLPCALLKDGRVCQYGLVRYRGSSARSYDPRSFRVELTHDETRPNGRILFFNAMEPSRQHMGMATFDLAGVPAPYVRLTAFGMNDGFWTSYANVERLDGFFLERWFPGDDGGNLYRGVRCTQLADLDYRGEDSAPYECSYDKVTNEDAADWSDLIALCRALNAPDEGYLAGVEAVADIDQWCRYLAVQTVLANQETCIYNDAGDDYYLYARPPDGKFILLPWDMDSVYRENVAEERLFRPELPAVKRLLRHPAHAPRFWRHLRELVDGSFGPDGVGRELGLLPAWVSRATLASFANFRERRDAYIRSQLAESLRACARVFAAGTIVADAIPRHAVWRYFTGTEDPAPGLEWTALDFDAAAWRLGPAGFGYGDNDDATVLADMQYSYTTVYVRCEFTLDRPEDLALQQLWVNYDDGFVCYLNGREIVRENAGAAGSVLAHDAVASGSHEQGTPATYAMDGFVAHARAGRNVLALIGLNNDAGSSDFSLDPALLALPGLVSGAPGGCDSPLLVPDGASILLEGFAPVADTSFVEVGGAPALYDVVTGAWRAALDQVPASIAVRALTAAGAPAAALDLAVLRRAPAEFAGAITGSRRLDALGGPYLFNGATVEAGVVLTVEAGAECLCSSARALVVRGELRVLGEEGAPVLLRRGFRSTDAAIVIEGGTAYIRGAEFLDGTTNMSPRLPTDPAAALPVNACRVQGGTLTLEQCAFRGWGAPCVSVAQGTLRAMGCLFAESAGGVRADGAAVELTACRFETLGPQDGVRHRNGGSLKVVECAFQDIAGHGIDTAAPSVIGLSTLVGIGRRALSFQGDADHQVAYVLAAWAETGVAVRSGGRCALDHMTCTGNALGIDVGSWGAGAARADLTNGIVWGNARAFALQGAGALQVAWTLFEDAAIASSGDNLLADPRFIDPAGGDWRVDSQSPARSRAADGSDLGALPRPEGQVLGGDVNRDARVNIADVIFLLGYLFANGDPPWCLPLADINGDGLKNIADPIHLLGYLFTSGAPPADPPASCGE